MFPDVDQEDLAVIPRSSVLGLGETALYSASSQGWGPPQDHKEGSGKTLGRKPWPETWGLTEIWPMKERGHLRRGANLGRTNRWAPPGVVASRELRRKCSFFWTHHTDNHLYKHLSVSALVVYKLQERKWYTFYGSSGSWFSVQWLAHSKYSVRLVLIDQVNENSPVNVGLVRKGWEAKLTGV